MPNCTPWGHAVDRLVEAALHLDEAFARTLSGCIKPLLPRQPLPLTCNSLTAEPAHADRHSPASAQRQLPARHPAQADPVGLLRSALSASARPFFMAGAGFVLQLLFRRPDRARRRGSTRQTQVTFSWKPEAIADHVIVGPDVKLYALATISIESHVLVSQGAHLCAGSHELSPAHLPERPRADSRGRRHLDRR